MNEQIESIIPHRICTRCQINKMWIDFSPRTNICRKCSTGRSEVGRLRKNTDHLSRPLKNK